MQPEGKVSEAFLSHLALGKGTVPSALPEQCQVSGSLVLPPGWVQGHGMQRAGWGVSGGAQSCTWEKNLGFPRGRPPPDTPWFPLG